MTTYDDLYGDFLHLLSNREILLNNVRDAKTSDGSDVANAGLDACTTEINRLFRKLIGSDDPTRKIVWG